MPRTEMYRKEGEWLFLVAKRCDGDALQSGLKILPDMMDRIYESIARLLELSPVYRLECLPNPDAARLCSQTCSP